MECPNVKTTHLPHQFNAPLFVFWGDADQALSLTNPLFGYHGGQFQKGIGLPLFDDEVRLDGADNGDCGVTGAMPLPPTDRIQHCGAVPHTPSVMLLQKIRQVAALLRESDLQADVVAVVSLGLRPCNDCANKTIAVNTARCVNVHCCIHGPFYHHLDRMDGGPRTEMNPVLDGYLWEQYPNDLRPPVAVLQEGAESPALPHQGAEEKR